MAIQADYPQPAHPERVGIPRYQDVAQYNRSLTALNTLLKFKLEDATKYMREWRLRRNKKLSIFDKMLHGSKWKAADNSDVEVISALMMRFNQNHITGAHYLIDFGWYDGDETFYYTMSALLRTFDTLILPPLKTLHTSTTKILPAAAQATLVRTIRTTLQGISDAYTELYARLRPAWRPRDPSTLPAPFCPLAVAIQRDISHPVELVAPKGFEYGSTHWECTLCQAIVKRCENHEGVKDWRRVPFIGHLRAASKGEKVKHACPGCLEVFEDWPELDRHVFTVEWADWVCGAPPAVLERYIIGTLGVKC
ncbi:hypothetical protein C8A05DRAFT_35057 [Staphylotrichum tortipilum]|uniref:Uncharacterized protein n=1 Tax=Staphylotrichum tortipilum TaxID=2831512 RepID=A0AAN6RSV7_9PEZI|nr:hypothetical protein C8A05DRAFT_35057 [Staphylotrichum longicolle]